MKLGLIQMAVTSDQAQCIQIARERIAALASRGAELIVLPEMFCCPYDTALFARYSETHGGPVQRAMADSARENGIWLVAGSLPEREGSRLYNTSFVYGPDGREITRCRKIHLFDVNIHGGQYFRESDSLSPGDSICAFDTPWGKIGLCICFDLRFAELFRAMALAGARLVVVPAAFNRTTGPAHWTLHFRARAVDNQLFTAGCAPARDESASYVSYGHSIVCDPWGRVLAEAEEHACDILTALDLSECDAIRAQLPILPALRGDIYPLARA